jgi:hypothetical protein
MLTRDQKEATLKVALVIAKEYASGGGGSQTVSVVLRNVYNTINRIKDEIEQTEPRPQKQGGGSQIRESDSLSTT